MKQVLNTFVDWRPIASVPILNRLLLSRDWTVFKLPTNTSTSTMSSANEADILYRFSCRNDGFIVFQIKSPEVGRRGVVSLAARISHQIKMDCGHYHVFNNDNCLDSDEFISTLPILCSHISDSNYEDFVDMVTDDLELKKLTAFSIRNDVPTDEPSVLALKKLYSSLFDRTCKRAIFYENNFGIWGYKSYNRKYVYLITLGSILSFIACLVLLYLNQKWEWDILPNIIFGILFVWISGVAFIHLRVNLGSLLFRKIRLQRALIGYCCHGNNLSRVLWKLYDESVLPPNNDYDPIIAVTESMIQSSLRRINAYYFSFSFAVGVLGLFVATVS